jgi:hypothetical protein
VAEARRPDHHTEVRDDRLLTPAEAAARFGVTKRDALGAILLARDRVSCGAEPS